MALIIGSRYDTFGEFEYIVLELNDGWCTWFLALVGVCLFMYFTSLMVFFLKKNNMYVMNERASYMFQTEK